MTILSEISRAIVDHISAVLLGSPLVFLVLRSFYRVFIHPLRRIPGPIISSVTSTWLNYHCYIGNEASTIHALHKKYGSVVRIGPNDVDIADGAALNAIYVDKGGFRKAGFYRNFDIDGHMSIFSSVDPAHRAPRAKAVLPLFSSASLRAGSDRIYGCVDHVVGNIRAASKSNEPVNILNLTRSLATDAVTSYLFQYSYGGLEEKSLSASGMVDTFVAGNRFFYLPSWLFFSLETWLPRMFPNHEADASLSKVDEFTKTVVSRTTSEKGDQVNGSYPARLLFQAKITPSEAVAQCKDLMFAGTDSSGMNFATIMLHLSRSPSTLKKLKEELTSEAHTSLTDPIELQSLPYLRGVVREALRTSMANPSRLGRVVPPEGLTYIPSGSSQHTSKPNTAGFYISAGTIVSCTPYELHFNPLVFPSPHTFDPERWSETNETNDMRRDFIPFGLGARQCIARNLATVELFVATAGIVRAGVLEGSRPFDPKLRAGDGRIPILEWFNSKVIGESIDLIWDQGMEE